MQITRNGGRRHRGFSLVELMVALAMLSILMGAIFSQINDSVRNSATE